MDRFSLEPRRCTQTYPQKLGNPLGCKNLVIRNGKKPEKMGVAWLGGISQKKVSWGHLEATPIIADKLSTGITGLF